MLRTMSGAIGLQSESVPLGNGRCVLVLGGVTDVLTRQTFQRYSAILIEIRKMNFGVYVPPITTKSKIHILEPTFIDRDQDQKCSRVA